MSEPKELGTRPQRPDAFPDTSWSEIVAAAEQASPRAQVALQNLCSQLLVSAVRLCSSQRLSTERKPRTSRKRSLRECSRKDISREYHRERGRFRTFLLACLKHFLANERDRASARKRRGSGPGSADGIRLRRRRREAAS